MVVVVDMFCISSMLNTRLLNFTLRLNRVWLEDGPTFGHCHTSFWTSKPSQSFRRPLSVRSRKLCHNYVDQRSFPRSVNNGHNLTSNARMGNMNETTSTRTCWARITLSVYIPGPGVGTLVPKQFIALWGAYLSLFFNIHTFLVSLRTFSAHFGTLSLSSHLFGSFMASCSVHTLSHFHYIR